MSIEVYKEDKKAFIFTLKNPHGVPPTRFMKKKDKRAIIFIPNYGPYFYGNIYISDLCNKENSCRVDVNKNQNYECHPQYKSSLFVNTAGPNDDNYFTVLDYEVYTNHLSSCQIL